MPAGPPLLQGKPGATPGPPEPCCSTTTTTGLFPPDTEWDSEM